MKRVSFFLVLTLTLFQYLSAIDTDCLNDSDCQQGEECVIFNPADEGLCILSRDLLDGDNVIEILWSENDTENADKINFFIFYDYNKETLISDLRVSSDSGFQSFTHNDIDTLEGKSELELYNIIVSNYMNILNLRPWNIYSGMFRFIKVNIKNYSDYNYLYNRLSETYSISLNQRNMMNHEIIIHKHLGGQNIGNEIIVNPKVSAVDEFLMPMNIEDVFYPYIDNYSWLWKPERLLSHEMGHDVGELDESYGGKYNYAGLYDFPYESNKWCPATMEDALYIKDNASAYSTRYNYSCSGGYAPDCFYDEEGMINTFDVDSQYFRATEDVVKDLCYDCDSRGLNCIPKNVDEEGSCILFDQNNNCIESVNQPVCENLFQIPGYAGTLLNHKWVRWIVWAKDHQNEYPLEYLPGFFRIKEYMDDPATYCFSPSFFTNMRHSFEGGKFNLIDETQIRLYAFRDYTTILNEVYQPFPDNYKFDFEGKPNIGSIRTSPYSTGYYNSNYAPSSYTYLAFSNITFDTDGKAEFKIFNRATEQDLEVFNSLVKKDSDLKVEWQVCWFTENPITMPIKSKRRSEICHIVEKRTCEENNIYGCMKSFKFHKKDFLRPVALSERNANVENTTINYVTVKAVIKDYGDYKASYQDEGLSMYYRTRYIDQTCKTAVPFRADNETVYPGEVSRIYSWHVSTGSLASQDLDCSESSCAPFDRTDSDGDLVPDKCDIYPDCAGNIDSDGDGIADECDNCPNEPNLVEMFEGNPFTDLAYGAKKSGNGYWQPYGNLQDSYFWQPDHDLDGIGDACDFKTDPDAKGYSTSHSWRHFGKSAPHWERELFDSFEMNSTIGIHVAGGYYGSNEVSLPITGIIRHNGGSHRVHYCGLDLAEYCFEVKPDKTGCTSKLNDWANRCETSTENGKTFGRSHATTTVISANGRERWPHVAWAESSAKAKGIRYSEVNEHKTAIPTANVFWPHPVAYWNWRADIYAQYNCTTEYGDYAICENTSGSIRENTPVYYDLSSNYVGNSDEYLLSSNSSVNPEYFKNYATRSDNSDYDQVGKWTMATRLNRDPMVVKHKRSSLLTPDELKDSYKNIIKNLVIEGSAPNILVSPYSLIFDEIDFVKYQTVGFLNSGSVSYSISESSIPVLSHMRQIISGDISGVTYSIAETDDVYSFFVNYAPSNDWNKMGNILNYSDHDLEWSSAAVYNKTVYIAAVEDVQSTVGKNLYRIVRDGDNFVIEPVQFLSLDGSQIRLISALGKLYVISDNNGVFSTMAINPETAETTLIDSGINPAFVRPLNIIGTETGIYIAGKYDPADQNNTIIAKLSDDNGWQIIHSGINAETEKLIMNVVDGRIIMTNILSDSDMTSRIDLDLSDDSLNIEEIETPDIYGIEKEEPEFCIYENDGSIFSGATNESGECVPVYNYDYETVSYFDYKRTVAGYKNNLYLGGLTGVRRVEIREDGTLENSDMLYTGETNNLVIYGNTMFGANYGEIDIYSIAGDGSITETNGISSSSCGNVRVSGDTLFTAENKRVRVFDLTDPQNPALVKTIATAGKVIDLEVIGERLYIYEETTSWFTTKGFTGIYDISNINSPVRTKYFEKRCTDAEMQRSGEAVYLGCKNGPFKVTDSGLYGVAGEKNFVREGFVYNKVLYQVFSGALHKSKAAERIAVCGDGVVENDEICDGNIVQCSSISSSYIGGTAACNSTCSGYNEANCEEDGW